MIKTMFQVATMTQAQADKAWCYTTRGRFLSESHFIWFPKVFYSKKSAVEWGVKHALNDETALVIRKVTVYTDADGVTIIPFGRREWVAL